MTRSGPLLRVKDSRAELAVGGRGAAALVQPADEIAFEDASPARREFNDRRSFAERDQTLQRTASEAGDRGGLIVGVDGERGLPAPHRGVTAFVPGQACRASRQDAHPPVGMRNDAHVVTGRAAVSEHRSTLRVAQAKLRVGATCARLAARRMSLLRRLRLPFGTHPSRAFGAQGVAIVAVSIVRDARPRLVSC